MKPTILITVAVLTACSSAGNAAAAPPAAVTAPAAWYYDDGVRRPLSVEPGLIAEVGPGAEASLVKALPAAELVHRSGSVSVFRAAPGEVARALTSSTRAVSRVSTVYREGGTPVGRLMALPGGVLVNFKAGWTEAEIKDFVAKRGLSLGVRMNLAGNWYTVNTAAGEASLLAANALQESGAVVSASPNWWKETSPR
jgi:hypothetical protein